MIYRRPSAQTLVLTAALATAASALFAFSRPAEMMVDGARVVSDVPPITTASDKAFVPLRSVADAIGAETLVEGNRVTVVRGDRSLRLRIGDVHASDNGMPLTLQHAPFRVRGRVMIGLNAFAHAFGMQATYDPRTARIDVLTPGIGRAPATAPTPQTE
ncbi:MAG TPA: copper amine oxidase N-terminal domain-containing protein [Candidatus Baltobacteraceae bacterium]|nr:copper amine oxidase N-terminal domain-containing protein [Candidatus Baltobacteraceae bacterium]